MMTECQFKSQHWRGPCRWCAYGFSGADAAAKMSDPGTCGGQCPMHYLRLPCRACLIPDAQCTLGFEFVGYDEDVPADPGPKPIDA